MTKLPEKAPIKVYVARLNQDGSPALQYIRLPPPSEEGYILRFELPLGSDVGSHAALCTNYPADGDVFSRDQFHCQRFQGRVFEDRYCDVPIRHVGAFEYHLEHDARKINGMPVGRVVKHRDNMLSRSESNTGYFVVEPMLRIHRHGQDDAHAEQLSLDGVALQSAIPKWLGDLDLWPKHMANAARLGYNLIHYAPVQARGESDSPYSIYDQMALSDELFKNAPMLDESARWKKLSETLHKIENDHGILAVADLVLNHTANNSLWLQNHPEAGYNLANSPHLTPAFELDEALIKFSGELASVYQLPDELKQQSDLDAVMDAFRVKVVSGLDLWQYYVIDTTAAIKQCRKHLTNGDPSHVRVVEVASAQLPTNLPEYTPADRVALFVKLAVRDEHPGKRFGKRVDMHVAVPFVLALCADASAATAAPSTENGWPSEIIDKACTVLLQLLDAVNMPFYARYDDDVAAIIRNIGNTARYERLEEDGPKRGRITANSPLMTTYFTQGSLVLANNGWVWGGNPLHDFAAPGSSAYLRRDVIVWGDCVKLRFGLHRDDNPWLWDYMTRYAKLMAQHFHGFRLDNCHSTPLALAEHVLDAARRVRPDLYVTAELFTGSEEVDITYVSRLGIHSLVRESMRADSVRELSRLAHRYGGMPIGSFDEKCHSTPGILHGDHDNKRVCLFIPVRPRAPHAIFMDCTHDNETPHQRRMAEDALPNAAVVSMSCCATGSVRGYDELFPKLLDLVQERRHYRLLDDPLACGIGALKQKLQQLHVEMARTGCNEIFVHQESQYILIHRQNPDTRRGYLLIAHSCFKGASQHCTMAPTVLQGTHAKYLFGGTLSVTSREAPQSDTEIFGLEGKLLPIEAPTVEVTYTKERTGHSTICVPEQFPPGSILMFETHVHGVDDGLEEFVTSGANEAIANLTPLELNIVLYRCNEEENDTTPGNGVYSVPNYGNLAYAGVQGFMWPLETIIANNDLAHPLCNHLREGGWALGYLRDRIDRHLTAYPALEPLRDWYAERILRIERVPNFLAPKLFALLVKAVFRAAISRALLRVPLLHQYGSHLSRLLSLCAVQMYGHVPSTGLHPTKPTACLSAGLPHFTFRHMRCWGRDTFIAMRGLLLITGNLNAAREHILAFASSIRHGLIPNLLDSLRKPRYNARDASWWFMQGVQDYCSIAPEGAAFLDTEVCRRFPKDDRYVDETDDEAYATSSTLGEILQEICQRHATGIHFREWNAGPNLDHAMQDAGFQIDVQLNPVTGFVSGGNEWNCGTWMDKMGDSKKAGNYGKPTTPRDGAPVEIVGLVKSAVTWLGKLHARGKFAHAGVQIEEGKYLCCLLIYQERTRLYTYNEWSAALRASFEHHFYVPDNPKNDVDYKIDSALANRRGIYKDTFGSSTPFADYQFRPNFPVAMMVAPELFKPEHALTALQRARDHLLGPLGMRTLDPADWAYRGDYNNSDDSDDRTIAHGANYHQGPEWLWCTGFFLRAYDMFDRKVHNGQLSSCARAAIDTTLRNMVAALRANPYTGLPELTNSNGKRCDGSCETQAWSAGTVLELLDQLNKHT
ncbi:glucanotransferase domain of glycogen debranching enzyme-domain-containing protein [Thamnocephalis sphaerospora]|uniref:Glycogen debranching enzyme n=1 Tax=Thamnocephalis sphaerospora TaxID=78915 RepID=A0A4P9XUW9_9FUNG|nr:glucanotransferase domain of glycogen debranching enzyme-domain-containing protein [Thamnocephalis sphaerospora]|eukprot:RKP10033.1 glucanotransferase domain of glycogen debranching enzyme-domain-containing protein [Thamnocephalis sphaerospora]